MPFFFFANNLLVVVVVQSLSCVRLFVTQWIPVHQAFLSIAISLSLLKLMSTQSVIPYNHLILCPPFSSCPQFFPANNLLLAVYFIFILYYRSDVRQKVNLSDVLSSKWVIKQWRQLTTPTTHLDQELLTNVQCCGGSRSFAKEPWRWEARWPAIRSWHQPTESIIKADLLTTTQDVAKELRVNHSMVIQYLKQIGKMKKLNKWVPHELARNQKITILKRHLLLYSFQEHIYYK